LSSRGWAKLLGAVRIAWIRNYQVLGSSRQLVLPLISAILSWLASFPGYPRSIGSRMMVARCRDFRITQMTYFLVTQLRYFRMGHLIQPAHHTKGSEAAEPVRLDGTVTASRSGKLAVTASTLMTNAEASGVSRQPLVGFAVYAVCSAAYPRRYGLTYSSNPIASCLGSPSLTPQRTSV
jgi:hypothetical protein